MDLGNSLVQHVHDIGLGEIWKAILNIVDYAVVAFLIFIAFANILKIQIDTYAAKKTIPSLVLGVLLANLSWYICIMILDFSKVLIDWTQTAMISSVSVKGLKAESYLSAYDGILTGTQKGFLSLMFLAIFGPAIKQQHSMNLIYLMLAPGLAITTAALPSLIQTLFGALLFAVMFILLIFTYFMFIIRVIVIDMLIVASPLAFLAIGFPMTQKLFQQWWSQFARWVFMAPLAFFLWAIGIVITLTMQSKMDSAGSNLVVGIIKYAMLGACLYFAIKLPFTMGGGIMSTWGGLGAKAGKWAGRGLDKKVGDWTKNGPLKGLTGGKRWSPIGQYLGWTQGAKRAYDAHINETTGTGEDIREGITGVVPRAWNLGKKVRYDKGKGWSTDGLKQVLEAEGGLRSAVWHTSGRGAATSMNKYLEKGKVLADSDQSDEMIIRHLDSAIGDNNADESREFMAAAAMRRLDVSKDSKDKFNKMDSNFMRACVRQSKIVNPNVNSNGVAWASMSDELSKAQGDLVDTMKVENARTHGATQKACLNNLNQVDKDGNKKFDDQGKWGTEQHAAYQFLSEQFNTGALKDPGDQAAFQAIRGAINKNMPPELKDLESKTQTLMDDFVKLPDFDAQKQFINDEVVAKIRLDLQPGEVDVDSQARSQLLDYVKQNHSYILNKMGADPSFSKSLGDAMGKVPARPYFSLTPSIGIKPITKISGIPTSHELVKGLDAKFAQSWDGLKNPASIDLKDKKDLKAVGHFTDQAKVNAHRNQMELVLNNMADQHPDIKVLFKHDATTGKIDVDHALKVNLGEELKQKDGLGLSAEKVEEMRNLHQKLQSINNSIEGYHQKGIRMKAEKDALDTLLTT